MRCPGCGENNDADYRFCRNCGRVMPAPEDQPAGEATAAVPAPDSFPTQAVFPPAESIQRYRLVATEGLLAGRTFTLTPKGLLIGRDPANCQVVVADDEISRSHAWVGFSDQGEVVVRDCQSANGTFVNRVRIQERVLRPADEISVGAGQRQLFRIEPIEVNPSNVSLTEPLLAPQMEPAPSVTSVVPPAPSAPPPGVSGRVENGTVAIKLTALSAPPPSRSDCGQVRGEETGSSRDGVGRGPRLNPLPTADASSLGLRGAR